MPESYHSANTMPEIQDTHLNKCIGCTYGKLFIMFYFYVKTYM